MAVSRRRRKELTKLKNQAEDLWDNQKELLNHASKVVSEAQRQARYYAREELSPRIRDRYTGSMKPVVDSAVSAAHSSFAGARSVAQQTRERIASDVLPGVASALGTTLAVIEVAKNQQVRAAIGRAAKFGTDVRARTGFTQPKPHTGPGSYVLIGLGVVALSVVAYAAWQTLRADDELWVEEDAVEVLPSE
ncbi:MAG: hypothetical protein ACRCSP_07760 [Rhodoglobus sp.]